MSVQDQIREDIQNNKVIVYMKGNPAAPMCGFSARVIDILKSCNVEFATRNVLENSALRQGIKDFTDWPTIPQVFINGEFIGGCDIMVEMHANGELAKLLAK